MENKEEHELKEDTGEEADTERSVSSYHSASASNLNKADSTS